MDGVDLKSVCQLNIDTESLASCVVVALVKSCGDESVDNDVYWHTREASVEVARAVGIRVTSLIRELDVVKRRFATNTLIGKPIILSDNAKDIWPYVAHPSLILEDVMES